MNLRRRLRRQMNDGDGPLFNVFGVKDHEVRAQVLIQVPGDT
jgi:hypothetical protein